MQTATASVDQFTVSLEDIGRTPLDRIPRDQVAEIVRRIVREQSDESVVDVAAFSSSM